MPKEISGLLVTNEYSTNGGSSWKTIVCEDTSQRSITSSPTEKKTKCGTFTSTSVNAVNITGSGVAGGNLASNQASVQDLAVLVTNMTDVLFRRQNAADVPNGIAAGEITYFLGNGKFTEATDDASVEDSVLFNWAFTSSGTYDLSGDS